MKKGILVLLVVATFTSKAQSLKDLLYSGKLKADSNSVIRKGDDLSSKIDTTTKKPTAPAVPKAAAASDNAVKKAVPTAATDVTGADIKDSASDAPTVVKTTAAPVKSNTRIWKEYTDSLVSTLKTEVLSSKKIKKETYYLTVDYEIGTDGVVSITNVVCDPENAFLQQQVKDRLVSGPPQLAPVTDSNGQTRKVKRRYNFTVTKE